MNEDMLVIRGPVVPLAGGRIVYSITLANGFVVTSPDGFPDFEFAKEPSPVSPLPLPNPAPEDRPQAPNAA
jgi:hypothetical protein